MTVAQRVLRDAVVEGHGHGRDPVMESYRKLLQDVGPQQASSRIAQRGPWSVEVRDEAGRKRVVTVTSPEYETFSSSIGRSDAAMRAALMDACIAEGRALSEAGRETAEAYISSLAVVDDAAASYWSQQASSALRSRALPGLKQASLDAQRVELEREARDARDPGRRVELVSEIARLRLEGLSVPRYDDDACVRLIRGPTSGVESLDQKRARDRAAAERSAVKAKVKKGRRAKATPA
jgi:hypothetical protein